MTRSRHVSQLRDTLPIIALWATSNLQSALSGFVGRWKSRFLDLNTESDTEPEDADIAALTEDTMKLRISRTNSWRVGPFGLKASELLKAASGGTALVAVPASPAPSLSKSSASSTGARAFTPQRTSKWPLTPPSSVSSSPTSNRLSPNRDAQGRPGRKNERPKSFDARDITNQWCLGAIPQRARDDGNLRAGLKRFHGVSPSETDGIEFTFTFKVW